MSKTKEKKPVSPAKALFDKFIFAFYVLALVAAVCFSSFVWFQKTYFVSYWVNGQSMWPTLNSETRTAKGVLFNDLSMSMDGATGVDFVIGDNGSQLSLGQRQRLSLARTFLLGKKVIILDEPTSALDPYTANKVMNNLYLELKNKLVIIISHNYSVLNRCDKVYLLKNGTFTELSNDSFNRL